MLSLNRLFVPALLVLLATTPACSKKTSDAETEAVEAQTPPSEAQTPPSEAPAPLPIPVEPAAPLIADTVPVPAGTQQAIEQVLTPIRHKDHANPLVAYIPKNSFFYLATSSHFDLQSPGFAAFLNHLDIVFNHWIDQADQDAPASVQATIAFLSGALKHLSPNKLKSLGLASDTMQNAVLYLQDQAPVLKLSVNDAKKLRSIFTSYFEDRNVDIKPPQGLSNEWQWIATNETDTGFLAIHWNIADNLVTLTVVPNEEQALKILPASLIPPPPDHRKFSSPAAELVNDDQTDVFVIGKIDLGMFIDSFAMLQAQFNRFSTRDDTQNSAHKLSPACIRDLHRLIDLVPTINIQMSALGPHFAVDTRLTFEITDAGIRTKLSRLQGTAFRLPTPKTQLSSLATLSGSLDLAVLLEWFTTIQASLKTEPFSCDLLTSFNTLADSLDPKLNDVLNKLAENPQSFGIRVDDMDKDLLRLNQTTGYYLAPGAAQLAVALDLLQTIDEAPQPPQDANADQDKATDETEAETATDVVAAAAPPSDDTAPDDDSPDADAAHDDEQAAVQGTQGLSDKQLEAIHLAPAYQDIFKNITFNASADKILFSSDAKMLERLASTKPETRNVLLHGELSERLGVWKDADTTHSTRVEATLSPSDDGLSVTLRYAIE